VKVKRVRGRKLVEEEIPNRFDRFSRSDLIDMLEASMMRNGELFRGLSHSELDPTWVLSQMETQAQMALGAIQALQRKVELQTF
jgi:hypothetical protein